MPELPEVEVTRRSFAEPIQAALILDAFLGKPLRWPLGLDVSLLRGRTIVQVRRRGKYLLIDLDEGLLLIHLGMSGSLRFASQLPERGVHDHFELLTDRGVLRLHDPRRFGAVVWAPDEHAPEAMKLLAGLGVEPLSETFTAEHLVEGVRGKRQSIKQVLLSGRIVVGVGNIYASEVLFLAGIRPTTSAGAISKRRLERLHAAIKEVLAHAVERGGSTLRDFSSADGTAGHFQTDANVYARAGLPCRTCEKPIRLLVQGQRSTFYCPHCQRA